LTVHPAYLAALTLVAALSAAIVLAVVPAARRIIANPGARDLELDGLRGFLAFFVFVHHSAVTWRYLQGDGWTEPPSRLFGQLGSASVALFFMVTAYLFWGRVLDRRGGLDWNGFWIGRLFRIYPAFLLALSGILLVAFAAQDFRLHTDAGTFLRALAAPDNQAAYVALALLAAALLVLVASASALLVEFPAMAVGRRLARRTVR
jgi:peptidoglycan/LPS O-acetylase OafA/YrhL